MWSERSFYNTFPSHQSLRTLVGHNTTTPSCHFCNFYHYAERSQYVTVRCPSVCLSQSAAGLLLWARPAGRWYRSIAASAAGEWCGKRHFVRRIAEHRVIRPINAFSKRFHDFICANSWRWQRQHADDWLYGAVTVQASCSSYCADSTPPIAVCSWIQQQLLGNASEL